MLLTAEDIYDWEVIDLEGCHGPEGDILGGYVTSLVLLLLDYWRYYFMSEIGGVSTVGISLPLFRSTYSMLQYVTSAQ